MSTCADLDDGMSHAGPKSQKQVPQLLSMGAIAAQEQQVTALRELLKQEESRLNMLKKVKGDQRQPLSTSHSKSLTDGGMDHTPAIPVGGVIQSSHNSNTTTRGRSTSRQGSHQQSQLQGPGMSTRLQQLVESVAVDQISSQTSKLKQSFQVHQQNLTSTTGNMVSHGLKILSNQSSKAPSPEVITIHDSPSTISPPPLTSVQSNHSMVVQMPTISSNHQLLKLDDAAIMRAIENSRRYKEFMMKQANSKRTFQKQIEKRIANAPYPKTFRQVWPIVPVYDPGFIKNLGLETVTMFFDPKWRTELSKPPPASKIKPICNQCGCDFASAWQIRKNNAKQVLLCESCDFSNLKLLQRTKLAGQLKELVESIRTDDEKFNSDCEEARKQMIAMEKQAILSSQGITHAVPNSQKSVITQQPAYSQLSSIGQQNHQLARTEPVSVLRSEVKGNPASAKQVGVIPSLLPSQIKSHESIRGTSSSLQRENTEQSRKRRLQDPDLTVSSRKAAKPSPNLDHTLNRITEQLLRRQVDEKCKGQNSDDLDLMQSSPTPGASPASETDKSTVSVATHLSTPNFGTDSGSRKSRRKGTPRQNRHLSNSSATD